ncbi:hypothetical protein INQ51_01125 [Maribellus sp. CM-23]|uniref:hypothetical protein n=1 Tax=Maribellus sp. CM-23 TaxID=2781026 RepID=UPI001F2554CE|nr:hypothetical protein [Maribellus sp. CM-23]MCE4562898.1 hypothetical protein [Maribellus sp. CM-23]
MTSRVMRSYQQQQKGQMDKLLYKTKNPISLYFCAVTSILFVVNAVLNGDNFWGPFIYILAYAIAVYWYLANYSGRLILTSNKIMVKYTITKYLDFEIPLTGLVEFDYKKGFYDLASDKSYVVNGFVPKIFYDTLILKYEFRNTKKEIEKQETKIKINTRMFQFDKFAETLKKEFKIKETVSW